MSSQPQSYSVQGVISGVEMWPNMGDVAVAHRGWIAGPFVKGMEDNPFELKMGIHKAGEKRVEWSKPSDGITLSLVQAGSITISFKDERGVVVSTTLGPGEMIRQSNQVPHKWEVGPAGAVIVTVRTTK